MEAHKRSIADILSPEVRYAAPLFQRPYVWTVSQNWQPLWDAIIEIVNKRLNGEPVKPYFLGALVLDKLTGSTGGVHSREIIDGQQRMTTLQLMMESARRLFATKPGCEKPALRLAKYTRNELENDSEMRFKVWPTNQDRAPFTRAMEGDDPDGLIGDAKRFFDRVIAEWIYEAFKIQSRRPTSLQNQSELTYCLLLLTLTAVTTVN